MRENGITSVMAVNWRQIHTQYESSSLFLLPFTLYWMEYYMLCIQIMISRDHSLASNLLLMCLYPRFNWCAWWYISKLYSSGLSSAGVRSGYCRRPTGKHRCYCCCHCCLHLSCLTTDPSITANYKILYQHYLYDYNILCQQIVVAYGCELVLWLNKW